MKLEFKVLILVHLPSIEIEKDSTFNSLLQQILMPFQCLLVYK